MAEREARRLAALRAAARMAHVLQPAREAVFAARAVGTRRRWRNMRDHAESVYQRLAELPLSHDWVAHPSGYEACRRCLRVRQASGSTDSKPCRGAVLSLRSE